MNTTDPTPPPSLSQYSYAPNDLVSLQVTQSFKAEINRCRNAVEQIDARVAELPQELRKLGEERALNLQEIDTHFALLPSLDRLDDDTLTCIFIAIVEAEALLDPPMSPEHPAVVISHVCRRWRQLALATKELWQRIYFIIPEYPKLCEPPASPKHSRLPGAPLDRFAKGQEMIEAWLTRSRVSQLRVRIRERTRFLLGIHRGFVEEEYLVFSDLVDLLCQTSHRWRALDLELGFFNSQKGDIPKSRFFSLPPQPNPVLNDVKLCIGQYPLAWSSPVQQPISRPSIFEASTLESLMIHHGHFLNDIVTLPVAWSNLKHLAFEGFQASALEIHEARALQILRMCPNLVSFCLRMDRESGEISQDFAPIPLPFLEELTLYPPRCNISSRFARSLILPSLHTLLVKSYRTSSLSPRNYEDSGLCAFVEQCGPTLRSVTFMSATLTKSALRRCLQHLPHVVSLTLARIWGPVPPHRDRAQIGVKFFRSLTPQFQDEMDDSKIIQYPLCPELEVFSCDVYLGRTGTEALLDFIEARRKVGGRDGRISRLKSVTHRYDDDGHSVDSIRELRRRGVNTDDFILTREYQCN